MPQAVKRTKANALIGEAVRARRETLGFTQEHLAEMADLSKNYVGIIERGEQEMRIGILLKLAKGLRCSASDLLKQAGH